VFRKGKRKKADVQEFERNLEDNLFSLHLEIKDKTYRHSDYTSFYITDPKSRHIHKACVKDRIVHHAIYRILYPLFDPAFINDSYSCRNKKGTHKAVKRLEKFTRIVSKNYTKPCWALKCDVKKYFSSVDHRILFGLIKRRVTDKKVLWLISEILSSFDSRERERERERDDPVLKIQPARRGLPIGNLTSQLFANVYLGELDQFIKHRLRIKYYLRYCDDFIILGNDYSSLENLIGQIQFFLECQLSLKLHPRKIIIRKLSSGIDFLGYIILPHYIVPRRRTVKRIFRNFEKKVTIEPQKANASLQSNLGYLSHANAYRISRILEEIYRVSK